MWPVWGGHMYKFGAQDYIPVVERKSEKTISHLVVNRWVDCQTQQSLML